jgi:sugar phosphate isomerase/epimerase
MMPEGHHTKMITRRELIARTVIGVTTASRLASNSNAAPLGLPIGCQLYPVRNQVAKDFEGTLQELAAAGFRSIELCSPHGYEKQGFGVLLSMKPSEIRQKIRAAGLTCDSSHYSLRELKESLPERIAYAKELGLKQMILASASLPKGATLDDWARVAGELNKIGEQTLKAGIQAGFHNHDVEFNKIDGVLVYDKLMSEFDSKLVKMQFQTVVARLGFDAPTIFEKYPGSRFISLHLQDWSSAEKKMVAIGKGQIDWTKLFAAAKKAGVKNYYVEMGLDEMRESVPYLDTLKTS